MRKSEISASMMCSNLINLKETIDVFEQENVEHLHIDVMDGDFKNCCNFLAFFIIVGTIFCPAKPGLTINKFIPSI